MKQKKRCKKKRLRVTLTGIQQVIYRRKEQVIVKDINLDFGEYWTVGKFRT